MALPQVAMRPMQDPMQDPMAGEEDGSLAPDPAAAEDDGSFTVCIKCLADGTFMVGKEGAEQADESPEAEASEDSGMQPADTKKQALTIALGIINASGRDTAEAQFDAGFSGRGQ